MNEKALLKFTRLRNWSFTFLITAIFTSHALTAQDTGSQSNREAIIKALQVSKNTRSQVGPNDIELLEKALSNPKFANRIQELSGSIYVMMHGISHREISGFTYLGKPVELMDKSSLLALNPETFFIVKDFQRAANSAFIDMDLHYNFDGTYNTCIRAESLLTKSNGQWKSQEHSAKTTR
ncbi:MAG TPA: hypothetical protein VJ911_00110 [Cryomorphaceae bacterium]|nr:hypothetical protein [Cryomorphaceae bacterium]